jgi:hypothetical protein
VLGYVQARNQEEEPVMKREHPKVVLTACDAEGAIIQELELSPYEWYDGEVPLIDREGEIQRLGVRSIEGYQTEEDGRVIQRWKQTYDAEGRLEDEWEWDDWKPSRPSPPPGQSAADQLRQLGLLPGQSRPDRQDASTPPSTKPEDPKQGTLPF